MNDGHTLALPIEKSLIHTDNLIKLVDREPKQYQSWSQGEARNNNGSSLSLECHHVNTYYY